MRIHIISFDVPYPPDYGGVMDVFYKMKALSECGVKVHLHVFSYGRPPRDELNAYCHKITYYKRAPLFAFQKPFWPYIISSRRNPKLLLNLENDADPILFEGLHTCAYLSHPHLHHKSRFVRTHNLEHQYYQGLALVEKNPIRKLYFKLEAQFLRSFEKKLGAATSILAISETDKQHLARYGNVRWIPPFHGNSKVISKTGLGKFALYHGNLGVGENDEAALFLVNHVFNTPIAPFVIAGNNPSLALRRAVTGKSHIQIRSVSDPNEIDLLIEEAQLHVLTTFQPTGIKLKLLNALYKGRHVLVNKHMLTGTGLNNLVTICDDPKDWKLKVQEKMNLPFVETDIDNRNQLLSGRYHDLTNAKELISLIWG